MKTFKNILSIFLFSILFWGCGKFFDFILIDDTSSYTRIMMHEFYNQEDNIDILFVGSSHCYRSFIPSVTDEIFEKNTFNAGSSSQQLDTSYALIKEASKKNNIEQVYLELYYRIAEESAYADRTTMTSTYIISDYMKPSFNKVSLLLNASSKEHYVNSFIPPRRNWEFFYDSDAVMDLIQKKCSPEYKNFSYDNVTYPAESYAGKGYVQNISIAPEGYFLSCFPFTIDGLSHDWEKSLYDIIAFCEQKNIKLTLVAAPMPNYSLTGKGNYDEYISKINELIADYDVRYYDFNLCKTEYFPDSTSLFSDSDHLNASGAQLFSEVFANFFTGKIPEEELFYDTYHEKLEALPPTIYGLNYHDITDSNTEQSIRNVSIVASCKTNLEYQIVMSPENSTPYTIQDFSEKDNFDISPTEHGICTITSREIDNQNILQTICIDY